MLLLLQALAWVGGVGVALGGGRVLIALACTNTPNSVRLCGGLGWWHSGAGLSGCGVLLRRGTGLTRDYRCEVLPVCGAFIGAAAWGGLLFGLRAGRARRTLGGAAPLGHYGPLSLALMMVLLPTALQLLLAPVARRGLAGSCVRRALGLLPALPLAAVFLRVLALGGCCRG